MRTQTTNIEPGLETAMEFGVQSTPTIVLFGGWKPVDRLRGGQNEQTLRKPISRNRD